MRLLVLSFILVLLVLLSFSRCVKVYTDEGFESPAKSSVDDESSGASEYYGWGYNPIESNHRRRRHHHKPEQRCPKCDEVYIDEHVCNIVVNERGGCKTCDITKHPDIDKYVLKSSVPPCPDMSKYATKSMLQPQVNLDNYVPKSELGAICSAYKPDEQQYILKTQCPPQQIKYVKIEEHPDYKNIIKQHCEAYKKSWTQNFEEWWDNVIHGKKSNRGDQSKSGFPLGYGYSPYAGYGTNNPGYALDGSVVSSKSVVSNAGPAE